MLGLGTGKDDRGLYVYGPTGTGKTQLACSVMNHLLDRGVFCRFLRTVDIPRNDQEALVELIDEGANPVLVLDDLGAEKQTPRLLECLYAIIDGRLWNGAYMVITSNYRPRDLARVLNAAEDGYGDRLVGRIREACRMVPLGGRDRR